MAMMTEGRSNSASFRSWQKLWQTYGKPMLSARNAIRMSVTYRWPEAAASRFSKAGKEQLAQRRTKLEALVAASRKKLRPLGEPLELDMGVHRWLADSREEAYSDWLAWLLGRLKSGEIAELFGISELISPSVRESKPLDVRRECSVAKGHEGAGGRLDITVTFGGNAVLVLELKKGTVDSADTAKQEGYFEEMERTGNRCRYILLSADPKEELRHRFSVFPYANLCLNVRRWASMRICDEPRGLTLIAMALALVGAIEANLLKLEITPAGLPSEAVLQHLAAFVKEKA